MSDIESKAKDELGNRFGPVGQLIIWMIGLSPALGYYLSEGNRIAESVSIAFAIIVCVVFASYLVGITMIAIQTLAKSQSETIKVANEFIAIRDDLEKLQEFANEVEEMTVIVGDFLDEEETKH